MFNIDYRIPFLVIGYGDEDSHLAYDFPYIDLTDNYTKDLLTITKKIEKKLVPGLLRVGEEILT